MKAIRIILSLLFAPALVHAGKAVNTNLLGLALKGYDPVAYFTDGKAVKGDSQYSWVWKDATWRFASAAHRELFKAAPETYAPQFGGYCAWAVSRNYTAGSDPENAWKIVQGKLYLNYNASVQKKWEEARDENIAKAEANWPAVLEK